MILLGFAIAWSFGFLTFWQAMILWIATSIVWIQAQKRWNLYLARRNARRRAQAQAYVLGAD